MNCQICKGACCEEFALPLRGIHPERDVDRWVLLHAEVERNLGAAMMRFECRCNKLTEEGTCSIYEERPDLCRNYLPGSTACLDTVKRRRTSEQFHQIREVVDPLSIHDRNGDGEST